MGSFGQNWFWKSSGYSGELLARVEGSHPSHPVRTKDSQYQMIIPHPCAQIEIGQTCLIDGEEVVYFGKPNDWNRMFAETSDRRGSWHTAMATCSAKGGNWQMADYWQAGPLTAFIGGNLYYWASTAYSDPAQGYLFQNGAAYVMDKNWTDGAYRCIRPL